MVRVWRVVGVVAGVGVVVLLAGSGYSASIDLVEVGEAKQTGMSVGAVSGNSDPGLAKNLGSTSRRGAPAQRTTTPTSPITNVPVSALRENFEASGCAATVFEDWQTFAGTPSSFPELLVREAFADPAYEPAKGSWEYQALDELGVWSAQQLRDMGREGAQERLDAWSIRRDLHWADPDEPSCEEQWDAVEAVVPGRGRSMLRPGLVHNVAVSAGWLVTWDGPGSALGQQRDLYEVEVVFESETHVLETTGLSLDIGDYVESHHLAEFTVRVRALHERIMLILDEWEGDWSAPLRFTTPAIALPGTPMNPSLVPAGEKWMFTWDAPEDGGPVETYYVVFGAHQMPVPATTPTLEVTDTLRSGGSPVIAKVNAWNQAGYSDWSEVTVTNPLTTSTPATTAPVPTPDQEGGFGPLVAVPTGVAVGVLVWWLVSRTRRPNSDTGRRKDRKGGGPTA